jgi:glycosyltransferase involved in cell wall biosynthesis
MNEVPPLKIVLASWAPFYAGAEVAALRLAQGLAEAGHQVTCIVGTEGELLQRLRQAGLECHYVPTRFTDKWRYWLYFAARRKLTSLLARLRPNVVHSNDLPTHQMVGDAARRLGLPRVCHHRWIFEGPAIDWLNKFGAERHLFVSQFLMDALCAASQRLAASPRAVVYDGLPLPPLPGDADRQAARVQLGLPPDKRLVLFAGQIIERKGVAEVLRAWHELAARWGPQAHLVLVGDDLENEGAYRRQMEQLARSLGLQVFFAGFQRNVPLWLTAADVVLVPSHAEPLGNATLEAMAHGRPVVGTRVGGIPEMVVDGQTGLLVPPRSPGALAAAIDRLLEDEPLRRRLGAAARTRCEALFSLKSHVASVVEQYRQVVAGDCGQPQTTVVAGAVL